MSWGLKELGLERLMTKSTLHSSPVSLAGAIIEHPNLGLLLQLRDGSAPNYPNSWGLFGGHMEEGESPETAVWRELEEELHLTPQMVSTWRLGQRFPHASGGDVYIYYMTTTATVDDLVLGEGEAMHYIRPDELDPPMPYEGRPFTDLAAKALQTYLSEHQ
jgi:8-oxo-dGTP pyrophosphatase MutT (NUDIX family)